MSVGVVGNVNVDLLAWPVADVPDAGTESPIDRVDLRVGGAAAVTGATLARLGVAATVVGCVGADAFGRVALDDLRRYGVDTRHVRRLEDAATGVSIAFEAPGRERSFLIALGALASFDADMVPAEALTADHVLVCGYFNLPAFRDAGARRVLEEIHSRGGTTLLDTGWDHAGWPPTTKTELTSLLPLVDVFLPNEAEASALSGQADPPAAAAALAGISGGWVVVKLGASGAIAVHAAGRSRRVAAPAVDVVDTTGAGDAFNAGLIDGLAGGADPAEALDDAVRVASSVVARPSEDRYPARDELIAHEKA
ncbi:MAG: carbohydrate kinase family protein [Actinomycetota bacterium]